MHLVFFVGKTTPHVFRRAANIFRNTLRSFAQWYFFEKAALLDEPVLNIIVGLNNIPKHDIFDHLYTVRESEKATRGVP